MRKFIGSIGAAALVAIMPVLPAPAGAAEIIRGGDCSGQALDADGQFIEGTDFSGSLLSRTTKSGITTLTCHYDVPEQYWPDKAVHASGFPCFINGIQTNDTRASMSTGGRMVLSCRMRA